MKIFLSKLFSLFFLIASACSPSSNSTTDFIPITIQLGTSHQAIYAGFYAADQNGDYTREGLKVNFILSGANVDVAAPVVDGTAQFGIIGASGLILERAEGNPIRALATISRRDPVVFFSLANSGITHIEDFVGKKVYVTQRLSSRLHAMLSHAGISPDGVIEVNTATVADLYSGDIDVASGSIATSVLSAQQAGYDLNLIYPDDYGVHFYSAVVFSSDDYIAANPEIVIKFLRATLQGWAYAIENPQTVGDMVLKYNPDADKAFETASMIASLPYIDTGEDYIGWMKPEVWQGMVNTMSEEGDITTPLDSADVYTLQFIEQIYRETNP